MTQHESAPRAKPYSSRAIAGFRDRLVPKDVARFEALPRLQQFMIAEAALRDVAHRQTLASPLSAVAYWLPDDAPGTG